MELHENTIGLLGERAEIPDDSNVMVLDTIIRWMAAGCPRTFKGPSRGGVRAAIAHGDSTILVDPVVVSEIAIWFPEDRTCVWSRDAVLGRPALVMELALGEIDSATQGEENEDQA